MILNKNTVHIGLFKCNLLKVNALNLCLSNYILFLQMSNGGGAIPLVKAFTLFFA